MNKVLSCHIGSNFFNVLLSSDVYSSDTWQIDNGQVGAVNGKYSQLDGVIDNSVASACYFISQLLDVVPDLIKVCVFFMRVVVLENCIWLPIGVPYINKFLLGSK